MTKPGERPGNHGTTHDEHRFVLDVEAFCLAIEPAPLFLQRTRP